MYRKATAKNLTITTALLAIFSLSIHSTMYADTPSSVVYTNTSSEKASAPQTDNEKGCVWREAVPRHKIEKEDCVGEFIKMPPDTTVRKPNIGLMPHKNTWEYVPTGS